MLLFKIGVDPVLFSIYNNPKFGVLTEAGKISCLTYVDDMDLIASSRDVAPND